MNNVMNNGNVMNNVMNNGNGMNNGNVNNGNVNNGNVNNGNVNNMTTEPTMNISTSASSLNLSDDLNISEDELDRQLNKILNEINNNKTVETIIILF